jgi:GNAT superfamily N-acetyltransferase
MKFDHYSNRWATRVQKLLKKFYFEDDLALDCLDVQFSFVCHKDQTLLGFVLTRADFYINYLVVDSPWQKKGIGSYLMKCVMKDRGSHIFHLTCDMKRCSFYERLGFSYIELEPDGRIHMASLGRPRTKNV